MSSEQQTGCDSKRMWQATGCDSKRMWQATGCDSKRMRQQDLNNGIKNEIEDESGEGEGTSLFPYVFCCLFVED